MEAFSFWCTGGMSENIFQRATSATDICGTATIRIPLPDAPIVNHMPSRQLGAYGEQLAAQWLTYLGWSIEACNWYSQYGELDLVARRDARSLVFVEVKTRRSTQQGLPQEAVTATKQRHLRKAACLWLAEHGQRIRHTDIRFDVIAIRMVRDHAQLTHIEGAFPWR
ncbi:Endonuclease [Bifidobacterium magnum]|uniref:UPF0102 protein BMAGN_0549 n=2 Tax=Bifidobacterium magnum TaxID=1692 RepID=A0A087BCD2_9BIFI|nr:Endonuclease [Bifidobacterium magnum]